MQGGPVRPLLWLQGGYFVITGIWPLAHMPSFLDVTGYKVELWLVETVGVLVLAIGLALLLSASRPLPPLSVITMAMVSSAGLAVIEVQYVLKGIILPIYLADVVVEVIFLVWWSMLLIKFRDPNPQVRSGLRSTALCTGGHGSFHRRHLTFIQATQIVIPAAIQMPQIIIGFCRRPLLIAPIIISSLCTRELLMFRAATYYIAAFALVVGIRTGTILILIQHGIR